jgi:hypothetical protein
MLYAENIWHSSVHLRRLGDDTLMLMVQMKG